VVLGIAPWNAPVILGVRAVATPLACGNTVVLKGSELCPATHGSSSRRCRSRPAAGRGQLRHQRAGRCGRRGRGDGGAPGGARVNFTGSTRVGKLIAQTCAKYLKPAVLELGGKAPFVVLDDADIDAAVNAAVFGAFANSGQICMSTERIVVDKAIADEFVAKFAARAQTLPLGDPREGPGGAGLGGRHEHGRALQCAH
jgi:benzaldehyde dehydrogenase (NAD)